MRTIGIIGIVIWLAAMAGFSRIQKCDHTEYLHGRSVIRTNRLFAVLVFLPVILWAGFRNGPGYVDTNAYIRFYSELPESFSGLKSHLRLHPKDPGFTVFAFFVKWLFGSSHTPFLLIIAIVEGLAVVTFYRRYSSQYLLSIFLFVASAEYFSWMFNGMRQFLAVSILLLAFPLYLNRKYLLFVPMVALACSVHMTAVIMVPLILVARRKPWSIFSMLAVILAFYALLRTDRFTEILNAAVQDTQYSESVYSWTSSGDDGANPIRVLVHAIPTILALFGRKQLKAANDPIMNICVNMSIVATSLWVIAMATSGIFMGRLPVYAGMFNYVLLPFEIETIFDRRSARAMTVLMCVCYLAFYFYQFHFTWHLI